MRPTRLLLALLLGAIPLLLPAGAGASPPEKRRIYIRPFVAAQGIADGDPIGTQIRDYVSEYIVEAGEYSLVSDDEVAQVLSRERTAAILGAGDDDAALRKLAASVKCDAMIYGTVSFADDAYTLTIKLLDAGGKLVNLERVKTLSFTGKLRIRMASRDLAAYVLTGEEPPLDPYEGREDAWVRGRMPSGIALSYARFWPSSVPFKDYYGALDGFSCDYQRRFRRFFAVTGGLSWATSRDDQTGDASVSIGSLGIGARAALPLLDTFLPYAGLEAKALWLRETGATTTANYAGYGVDVIAGIAVSPRARWNLFAQYRRSWAAAADERGTDLSGNRVDAGLLYSFH